MGRPAAFSRPSAADLRLLGAGLLVGSLLIASLAAFVGELAGLGARHLTRTLLADPLAADETAYSLAGQRLDLALRLGPDNPGTHMLKGFLASRRASGLTQCEASCEAQRAALRQASLQSFRRAIAAQPSWPYNWIYLAQEKLAAGELDQEFRAAFQQALRLGSREPLIQDMALDLLVQSWPMLAGDPVIRESFPD